MSRQVVMRHNGDGACLERALSANVIGTAAYSAPELLLADSPVKRNQVDAGTVLKSDVSFCNTSSTLYSCGAASIEEGRRGEGGHNLQLLEGGEGGPAASAIAWRGAARGGGVRGQLLQLLGGGGVGVSRNDSAGN